MACSSLPCETTHDHRFKITNPGIPYATPLPSFLTKYVICLFIMFIFHCLPSALVCKLYEGKNLVHFVQ